MRCKRLELEAKPWKVQWINEKGCVYVEGRNGKILIGGETWGTFVWGDKKYFISIVNGLTPVVYVDSYVLKIKDRCGWKLLCFSKKDIDCDLEPWSPLSLVVRGVDVPVRKGVLLALPDLP